MATSRLFSDNCSNSFWVGAAKEGRHSTGKALDETGVEAFKEDLLLGVDVIGFEKEDCLLVSIATSQVFGLIFGKDEETMSSGLRDEDEIGTPSSEAKNTRRLSFTFVPIIMRDAFSKGICCDIKSCSKLNGSVEGTTRQESRSTFVCVLEIALTAPVSIAEAANT